MAKASASILADDEVVIARLVKARGIRGEVACEMATDFPERFQTLENTATTIVTAHGARLTLVLEKRWFHKDRVILKFKGVDTMTAAEELVGGRLIISDAEAWELDDDEFYEYDLIGLQAVTTDGESIGRVKELLRTGGADVLVVELRDGREAMIPFVDEICPTVDLEAGQIVVKPPAGLLEL